MKTKLLLFAVLLTASFQFTNAQCFRSGAFVQSDPAYAISGTGNITFDNNGDKNVVFESDFATVQGADLRVYLSKTDDILAAGSDAIEVTTVQLMNDGGGTGGAGVSPITGMMSFPIPAAVDLDDFDYIVMQCIVINERWGHVSLGAVSGVNCTLLAVQEDVFEKEVRMYPNLVKDNLHINTSLSEVINIKIYTILGEILLDEKITSAMTINTQNFKKGLYLVEMTSGNKKIIKKLIKN